LAEPTITDPDEVPPPSGLEPVLDDADDAPVEADGELEELPLEQAATVAMPTTASAAIPLLAQNLMVIWISFRTGVTQFGLLTPVSRKKHPDRD
jgi:hypothetical protein